MRAKNRHLIAFWVTALLMGLAALPMVVPKGKFFLVHGAFFFDSRMDYLLTLAAYSALLTMIFVPLGWLIDRFGEGTGRGILLVPILALVLGLVIFSISAEGRTLGLKLSSPGMRWAFYPFFFLVYCAILVFLNPAPEKKVPAKKKKGSKKKR